LDIELRPLQLAEIFDRIFQLYRARFSLFLGIAAVSTTVELAWNAFYSFNSRWLLHSNLSQTARQSITSRAVVIGWGFVFAAAALSLAATNRALAAIYDGRPTSIAQSYSALRSNWLRCIWVSTLTYLIAWGAAILVLVGAVGAILLAKRAQNVGQANALTAIYGATGLLILVTIPLCVWLTLRYSLAVPACVDEGLKTVASLKRSGFLAQGTQGTRGRIFLLLFIVVCAQSMIGVVLLTPLVAIFIKHPGHTSFGATLYTILATAITSALVKPIYSIGLTLIYYDARVRKEGWDLERALQRSVAGAEATG
jgi:hypothetical protein